jgi:D-alanyl-lipoteichoic acid acyltransferase DltB (MBOAT superfamily)
VCPQADRDAPTAPRGPAMNFAESRFWLLLIVGLVAIVLVRHAARLILARQPQDLDKVLLCGLGLFLLVYVGWVTFIVFVGVAAGSYVGLLWILRRPAATHRRYLFVLIVLQLLPLLYYKYAHFATSQILGRDVRLLSDLVIPVGISFYTFQKVAFVVDTLAHHTPLPRFLDYMNFAGFFPQIVAGPIERRADLLPQMETFRFRWSMANINEGAAWMTLGLFFKLSLADNLALHFDGASSSNAYLIWLANILFGLRIYYDFAGYSLIALGLARCLGIRLTVNFLSPYAATSAADFWRRWHVTLSQWFRDYVYVPLGGGRVRWWAFNITIVFLVSGIWHGAGWNFVCWGAAHGLALMVNRWFGARMTMPSVLGWLLTMITVFSAWLAFYETRTDVLARKALTLLRPEAYGRVARLEALQHLSSPEGVVTCCILALTGVVLTIEWLSVRNRREPYRFFLAPVISIALVILTVLLAPGTSNGFIYFAF